jgi:1,4-alpha-glucan branching enzyme
MPYVEGFEVAPHGESWLWEALVDVYLPMLDVIGGECLTVGLTPVLCDQLESLTGPSGDRFVAYVDERIDLHLQESAAYEQRGEHAVAHALRSAAARYLSAREAFSALDRDVLGAWSALARSGRPAAMSSAATHAVMPLLSTVLGRELQLGVGVTAHTRRFGAWDRSFWLPECAYAEGVDDLLAQHGARAFCVEQTAGYAPGAHEHLEPIRTAAGPVAIPIDRQTVSLVWDRDTGYPSSGTYRDHHTLRTPAGLKAWSYAGDPYEPGSARSLAERDGARFVDSVERRLREYRANRGCDGVLCCAFDAELFGHWWYEGQTWLAAVLREARERHLELVTLAQAAHRRPAVSRQLDGSTWALDGAFSTWDSPRVVELTAAAAGSELAFERSIGDESRMPGPAAVRAARELLALQASDWAFQITHGWAGGYPERRWRGHAAAFADALQAELGGRPIDPKLGSLAPDITRRALLRYARSARDRGPAHRDGSRGRAPRRHPTVPAKHRY